METNDSPLKQLLLNGQVMCENETEYEGLVHWMTNINLIMNKTIISNAIAHEVSIDTNSLSYVSYPAIVSQIISMLDSKCLGKHLSISALILLRKIIEVQNKQSIAPAADWSNDDWKDFKQSIEKKQE